MLTGHLSSAFDITCSYCNSWWWAKKIQSNWLAVLGGRQRRRQGPWLEVLQFKPRAGAGEEMKMMQEESCLGKNLVNRSRTQNQKRKRVCTPREQKATSLNSDTFLKLDRVGKFLFITKSQMPANPLWIRSFRRNTWSGMRKQPTHKYSGSPSGDFVWGTG